MESGRISSVDPAADVRDMGAPPLCNGIDLSHCTLIPALVDSHVHLFMSGTLDPDVRRRQLRQPFREMKSVISEHLRRQFLHGVLAVRDGGDYGGYSLRYRNECMRDHPLVIVKTPGRAWRAPGRYGSLIGRPPGEDASLGVAVARDLSLFEETGPSPQGPGTEKARPERGPDHVKLVQSGLNSLIRFGRETPPQFSRHDLKAAVDAAVRAGRPTMVHANGRIPVRQALEAGCRSVEHGFFMGRENLERMAGLPVTWVPTAFTMQAYAATLEPGARQSETARKTLDHQLEQMALARRLGVTAAAGTDCGSLGVHHGKALKEEIRMFRTAGYSVEEALQCASGNGARLLDLEDELGTLVPGMPATFLAVEAAPDDLPDALDCLEGVYIRGRKQAGTGP